jgi:hypothetical protein
LNVDGQRRKAGHGAAAPNAGDMVALVNVAA